LLEDLRTMVRRHDLPDHAPVPDSAQLRVDLDQARTLVQQADLAGLLRVLPGLRTGHHVRARGGQSAVVGAAHSLVPRRPSPPAYCICVS
ncbi:MAG: hypothetical protein ACRDRT_09215, partial [Pseudonocardiaceae bacterium]